MNQKISTGVGAMILIIISLTIGVFVWKYYQLNPIPKINNFIQGGNKKEPIACTMEAKLCSDGSYVSRSGPNCEFAACSEITGIENKIIITSPKIDDTISSPVKISGRAVGGWFFEGSFPVSIHDDSGKVLARGIAEFIPSYPGEEWMTENFVNFEAEVKFTAPAIPAGYILFTKDNPSGKPELDESFRLPVKFGNSAETSDWQTYRNEKYGFEISFPNTWKSTKNDFGFFAHINNKADYNYLSFHPDGTDYQMIMISLFTRDEVENAAAKKNFVGQSEKYVFMNPPFVDYSNYDCIRSGQYSEFEQARCREIPEIIKTFKVIK